MNILKYTGRGMVWFLSIAVALASYRFLIGGVAQTMDIVAHNLDTRKIPLYAHIGFAPIALLLMPFQFWTGLRVTRPLVHRWMGRIYVLAVAISGISGLYIAFFTIMGPFAAAGFGLLAIVWLATTYLAYSHARARRIAAHKKWMVRSAALTFAAVTLRLWLPFFFIATNLEFSVFYPWVAWLCWVPNLIAAEIYLRRRTSVL